MALDGQHLVLHLDVRKIDCPSCGCHDRWEVASEAPRREEDPLSIIGILLFCDCAAETIVYVDVGELLGHAD
jgi:hypothetical protein